MKVHPFLKDRVRSLQSRKLFFVASFLLVFILVLQNCTDPSSSNSSTTDTTPTIEGFVSGTDLSAVYTGSEKFLTPTAFRVPHDEADSSQTALATFAWKEFIALNWPSNYSTSTPTRGVPDSSQSALSFLKPDPNKPLVWQTYKHRVEVYPVNTASYNKNFDTPPQYFYKVEGQTDIPKYKDPGGKPLSQLTTYFNNLDESSEIGLATIFYEGDPDAPGANSNPKPSITNGGPGALRRVIYQAKASRVMFDYVVENNLYDSLTRVNKIDTTLNAINNKGQGGLPTCPDPSLICFPHGDVAGSEGSIEIKASWRQLTLEEYNTGRFLTAPILRYIKDVDPSNPQDSMIFYDIVPAAPTATSLPYGLLGLHIIHKTVHFPTYVFATFEQVDNLDPQKKLNQLSYYNNPRGGIVNPGKQYVVNRPHPIVSATQNVNNAVHEEIIKMDSTSVWQYYQLIGVQGPASNNQDTTDFFLANIVTETNEILRSFSGTLSNEYGTINPTAANIHVGSNLVIGGGCKGCHGNAQQSDFSFITQNAPFDGTPDVINAPLYIPLDQ